LAAGLNEWPELPAEQCTRACFPRHDLAVIDGLADTVGVLYHGKESVKR
jgi:hypothetical protein